MRHETERMLPEFDQIVVGGGVVGLAAALGLARAGRVVALLSDRPAPTWNADVPPGRVSTLNRSSVDVLQALDVWPVPRAHAFTSMHVWDAHSEASIRFSAHELGDGPEPGEEVLGHTVEHAALEVALWRAAEAAGVALFAETRWMHLDEESASVALLVRTARRQSHSETEDGGSEAHVPMMRLRARWVLAADGARSALRDRVGLATSERDYAMRGIVATFWPELPHEDCARQRFDGKDVVALLPLADGRVSLVWSCPAGAAEARLALDEAAFSEAVSQASGHVLGALQMRGPRGAWPLVGRHAQRYGRGRVLLLGDAAHTIHPLAGQGLNLGLADADALLRALSSAATASDRSTPEEVLRRYEAARRIGNMTMLHAMEAFHALFATENAAVRQLRAQGVLAVDASSWWKRRFAAHAGGASPVL